MNDKKLLYAGIIPDDVLEERIQKCRDNCFCLDGVRCNDINVMPEHFELIMRAVRERQEEVLCLENQTPYDPADQRHWRRINYKLVINPRGEENGNIIQYAEKPSFFADIPGLDKTDVYGSKDRLAVFTAPAKKARLLESRNVALRYERDEIMDHVKTVIKQAAEKELIKLQLVNPKPPIKAEIDQIESPPLMEVTNLDCLQREAVYKIQEWEIGIETDKGQVLFEFTMPGIDEKAFRPGIVESALHGLETTLAEMIGFAGIYPVRIHIRNMFTERKENNRVAVKIEYKVVALVRRVKVPVKYNVPKKADA